MRTRSKHCSQSQKTPSRRWKREFQQKGSTVGVDGNPSRKGQGDTPLILAASGGGFEETKIVKLLLERGDEVGVKNNHGDTALTLATKKGRAAAIQLLKKAMP